MFDDEGGVRPGAGDVCGEVTVWSEDDFEAALAAGWVPPDPEDPWSEGWLSGLGGDVFDSFEPVAVPAARPPGSRPGFQPVDAVNALVGSELARCSASELVEVVVAAQRLIAWVQAGQAEALAALTRCPEMRPEVSPATARHGFGSLSAVTIAAAEVAQVLSLTTRQAENLVGEAIRLVEDFPLTLAALRVGRLDARRAKVVADELGGQEPRVRRAVEEAVVGFTDGADSLSGVDGADGASGVDGSDGAVPGTVSAGESPEVSGLDSTMLRRRLRRAVYEVAPVAAVRRHIAARARRYVRMSPAADGMAWLEALLPAEDAVAVTRAIDAAAVTLKTRDREAGDPRLRTADQRRADALAALGWASLATGRLGGHDPACRCPDTITLARMRDRPVSVDVTVSLPTLTGCDDQAADLAGYGPIPAHVARALSVAGVWRWLHHDPVTGVLLDYGRTRYTPTPALAEFILARDRECRMPGCHRPARACQLDHTLAFPTGPTAARNLGPLCHTHHVLKHHSRWRVEQPQPGHFIWTSPTGRVSRAGPDDYRPRTREGPPGQADQAVGVVRDQVIEDQEPNEQAVNAVPTDSNPGRPSPPNDDPPF